MRYFGIDMIDKVIRCERHVLITQHHMIAQCRGIHGLIEVKKVGGYCTTRSIENANVTECIKIVVGKQISAIAIKLCAVKLQMHASYQSLCINQGAVVAQLIGVN